MGRLERTEAIEKKEEKKLTREEITLC